ncbi:MAG: hypothetical protein QM493_11935 [Sulfurovum sp.]
MKKILLSCVLVGSLAMGQDIARIDTMHNLENAMSTIQKGFLRNNKAIVKLGTDNLKSNLKNIELFVIKPTAKDKNFNPKTYAVTESEAIINLADEIVQNFEDGKNNESRESFNKVLSRCLSCHKIIRKW